MPDKTAGQADATMHEAMAQATAGKPLNAEQQKIVAETQSGMMDLMKEQLGWDTLQPIMLEVYRKSLTQEDVDGMLKFYQSRAGQALIAKMPAIMQKSMSSMQERMMPMTKKIQEEVQAIAKEYAPK